MTLLSPVSWWYNWKVTANHDLPPGDYCTCSTGSCGPPPRDKNFVPMVWNIKLMQEDPVDDRYPILLGFNEPNHADQADIEPEVAAAAWIELQNLYPDKVGTVPPSSSLIFLLSPRRSWSVRPLQVEIPTGSIRSLRWRIFFI